MLTITSPSSTSAATLAGLATSATSVSRPPSLSAISASLSALRAARTGFIPRAAIASAVSRPVYPVAPKRTIRCPPSADHLILGEPAEVPVALLGHDDQVLDPDAQFAGDVNAGLDRDHVSRPQRVLGASFERRGASCTSSPTPCPSPWPK